MLGVSLASWAVSQGNGSSRSLVTIGPLQAKEAAIQTLWKRVRLQGANRGHGGCLPKQNRTHPGNRSPYAEVSLGLLPVQYCSRSPGASPAAKPEGAKELSLLGLAASPCRPDTYSQQQFIPLCSDLAGKWIHLKNKKKTTQEHFPTLRESRTGSSWCRRQGWGHNSCDPKATAAPSDEGAVLRGCTACNGNKD